MVVDRRPVLRAEGPAEQGTKEAGYSEAVSRRPITLLLAAVCEGLLGVLLFILGGYVLVNTLLGNATDVNFALPLAVFAFGGSAALCYVAWGLFHLKEWARTPIVLTQLFALVIAYYLWTSDQVHLSLGLGAFAVFTLLFVLAPPTTATLFPPEGAAKKQR
jgi:peptidoglycan/LPS O-acetylase OafA/YrhL